MGHKIFVSYKYADDGVLNLESNANSTVRDYVDEFEKKLDKTDDIYKGESDGEDLSQLSEDTIWEKLKDRIYDSSLTVVFISPNMKDDYKEDKNQWIPWEISYSLKEVSRKNKNGDPVTSKMNAMIAVVLPDSNGSYSYYLEEKNCCSSTCTMHYINTLFDIIRKNKFNYNNANTEECDNKDTIWYGTCSYIEAVKWCDFISDINKYIDKAYERQDDVSNYEISKEVE
ncbi:TIR domain-containing protein [Clostridium butyricum]|uniref:Thoeris protein ThsB TIR-like domain-containing protein n=1 Tax=Clostridium butyricum E4 str. BoNT E BL5262 TaxID=632245 RepID=C4IHA8_CLOBU|nr:TIR domain-containing protein [Clostridium butyricum]EDT75460.1 conserved hypothetical protein [Clostridium butyricum 5521]EEP53219.1 conserved hypothetical protein [Clostridium butyricum E4 str. BoNT E BL5262]NFL30250.1 hypothetical protein [Clostridium butyricum]NFS17648.1 hypothetical protein [Clostridium butyricum]